MHLNDCLRRPHGAVTSAGVALRAMNTLSRRAHGALDYIVGIVLIAAPKLFGFEGGIEAQIPFYLGIGTIVYSLLTDYELGLLRVMPFRVHLTIDVFAGLFLAASPWLFQFADRVWVPHLVVGVLELGAVFMTATRASLHDHHHHPPGAPARS